MRSPIFNLGDGWDTDIDEDELMSLLTPETT